MEVRRASVFDRLGPRLPSASPKHKCDQVLADERSRRNSNHVHQEDRGWNRRHQEVRGRNPRHHQEDWGGRNPRHQQEDRGRHQHQSAVVEVPPNRCYKKNSRVWRRNADDLSSSSSTSRELSSPSTIPPRQEEEGSGPSTVTGQCSSSSSSSSISSSSSSNEVTSSSTGGFLTLLRPLQRHRQAVTAISFPSDSDKLFSASKDGTFLVWDCNTGHCVSEMQLGAPVGCLMAHAPWVFVGLPGIVKAWNTSTSTATDLPAHTGGGGEGVYALARDDQRLFAATHEGAVLSWRYPTSPADHAILPDTPLLGHQGPVLSITLPPNTSSASDKLYTASADATIRVWDRTTSRCLQILSGHTDAVTSVLCWGDYLLSCSLDRTIKVWDRDQQGGLHVLYTHTEDHSLLAMHGITDDAGSKSILICSAKDNTVRLYDLPSFTEKGRIYSKEEVSTLHTYDKGGLFFTGDATGDLKVWKLANCSSATSS